MRSSVAKPFACFIVAFLAACQTDTEGQLASATVREYVLESPQELVSLESGLLASPVDLAIDTAGILYLLDRIDRRVVAISPDGEMLALIGGPGSGPGEFESPRVLEVDGDRLYVFDAGQRSVQAFALDGRYLTGHRTELIGAPLSVALGPGGSFAYLSFPPEDALVRVLDGSGLEVATAGNVVSDEPIRSGTLLERLHQGEIPGFMRNRALPFFGDDGTLWMFLQTEGVLQRFAPGGTLEATATVRVPEMDLIQREFFDWYAGQTELGGILFLAYVDAAAVVGDSVWLLWKVPLDYPALVTVHDRNGTMTARLVISGLETQLAITDPNRPPPSRSFAVDPAQERLYLADDLSLTLSRVRVPGVVFGRAR